MVTPKGVWDAAPRSEGGWWACSYTSRSASITSLVEVNEPGAADFRRSAGYTRNPNTERYTKDLTR